MRIKGTVTPDIAMQISGYDFDVRTTKNNVNLIFDNGHVQTHLVCYKLGNNKFEVEAIFDPLHLFRQDLDKGDLMNTSEVANVMIRQALKDNDMRNVESAIKRKKKINTTGCEDGKLVGYPSEMVGTGECGSVACSLGTFVGLDANYEQIVSTLSFIPKPEEISVMYDYIFIPNSKGVLLVNMANAKDDPEFYQFFTVITGDGNANRVKQAMSMSDKLDKGTWIFDIDKYYDTKAHDYGTIRYREDVKKWYWAIGYNNLIPITLKDTVVILKYASEGKSKLEAAKAIGKTY